MSTNPDGTPIVIRQSLYDYLANKADSKGITKKRFANDLLLSISKRYEFLERRFPNIKVDAVGSGFLMLQDYSNAKRVETVAVRVEHNGDIECLSHKGQTCDHVKYTCMSPDIDNILIPEDITESAAGEGSKEHNNNKTLLAATKIIL